MAKQDISIGTLVDKVNRGELILREAIMGKFIKLLVVTGLVSSSNSFAFCPEGLKQVGLEPPKGDQIYCQNTAGEMHGPYVEWFNEKSKSVQGSYANGLENGEWIYWHKNGQVQAKVRFQNGNISNLESFSEDGAARQEHPGAFSQRLNLSDCQKNASIIGLPFPAGLLQACWTSYNGVDVRHGKAVAWHENGNIKLQGQYNFGVLIGITEWDEKGQSIRDVKFADHSDLVCSKGTKLVQLNEGIIVKEASAEEGCMIQGTDMVPPRKDYAEIHGYWLSFHKKGISTSSKNIQRLSFYNHSTLVKMKQWDEHGVVLKEAIVENGNVIDRAWSDTGGTQSVGKPSNTPDTDDVKYEILNDNRTANIKRSVDVRINKEVSKEALGNIAERIKADFQFERTFISYYLPEMTVGAGAWATSHYDPNLSVSILLTKETRDAYEDTVGKKRVSQTKWTNEVSKDKKLLKKLVGDLSDKLKSYKGNKIPSQHLKTLVDNGQKVEVLYNKYNEEIFPPKNHRDQEGQKWLEVVSFAQNVYLDFIPLGLIRPKPLDHFSNPRGTEDQIKYFHEYEKNYSVLAH